MGVLFLEEGNMAGNCKLELHIPIVTTEKLLKTQKHGLCYNSGSTCGTKHEVTRSDMAGASLGNENMRNSVSYNGKQTWHRNYC